MPRLNIEKQEPFFYKMETLQSGDSPFLLRGTVLILLERSLKLSRSV